MRLGRLAGFLLAGLVAAAGAQAQGIDQEYRKPAAAQTWGELLSSYIGYGGFGKSYALVIGVSKYTGGFSSLPTANDPIRMKEFLLNEAGFDYVHVLTEEKVTDRRIRELMVDVLPGMLGQNDRFLFYWSGHGETRTVGRNAFGYLPLRDSEKDRYSTMIPMGDIQRWDQMLDARQVLFLLDACFSGLAGVARQGADRDQRIAALSRPSHQILTAGTSEEQTIAGDRWGGSLFTDTFIRAERGAADTGGADYKPDGVVSLAELEEYVQRRVASEREIAGWQKSITPQRRDLQSSDGQFFFVTNEQKLAKTASANASFQIPFKDGVPLVQKGDDAVPIPAPAPPVPLAPTPAPARVPLASAPASRPGAQAALPQPAQRAAPQGPVIASLQPPRPAQTLSANGPSVAIPDFFGESEIGRNIAALIRSDLESGGLIRVLNPGSYKSRITDLNAEPSFDEWRAIQAQSLITGQVIKAPDGTMETDFRLWNLSNQQQEYDAQFDTATNDWRRTAHAIADEISERVIGARGNYNTRIAFVSETGQGNARRKRLAIMDLDGANLTYLTPLGTYDVSAPRFGPAPNLLTYVSAISGTARLYLLNLDTLEQIPLRDAVAGSAHISHDGNTIVAAFEDKDGMNIYAVDTRSPDNWRALTRGNGYSQMPDVSPDGKQIAYVSSRDRNLRIYVMNMNGGGARRLLSGTAQGLNPAWSPNGEWIAYQAPTSQGFRIAIMRPDGRERRDLSSPGFIDGFPSWAPNGQRIVFSRRPFGGAEVGTAQLWSVDLSGANERRVETAEGATQPSWSPSRD